MNNSDFRSKMLRHPMAPKIPATIAVPANPAQPAPQPVPASSVNPVNPVGNAVITQPGFELPDPNKPMTLDALVNLTRDGDSVSVPKSRPMTPQEIEMVRAGKSPDLALSELERRNLIKAGWEEGTVPPAGFPDALQEIISGYVNQKRTEGVPFDQIKIRDISDLPPEEQIKVKAAFQSLLEQERNKPSVTVSELTEYPESIRNEIMKIQNKEIPQRIIPQQQPVSQPSPQPAPQSTPQPAPQSTPQSISESVAPPVSPAPQPVSSQVSVSVPALVLPGVCPTCGCNPHDGKRRLTCIHCGSDPLENPDEFKIEKVDKQQFLTAIGSGHPFKKNYSAFNGKISVMFRSLKSMEYEHLSLWAASRAAKEVSPRAESYSNFLERVSYYELMGGLVLQTVLLKGTDEGSTLFWASPEGIYAGLKEWKEHFGINGFDELLERFQEEIPSESVITAIRLCLIDFNRLDYRLTREGLNTENFWKGI
jgi:hypothetical protein